MADNGARSMTNAGLLSEARKLDAEATPGPWRAEGCMIRASQRDYIANVYKGKDDEDKHDRDFIARARTLLPQLADALEQAEAVIKIAIDGADVYKRRWEASQEDWNRTVATMQENDRLAASAKGWEQDALLHATNEGNERRRRKKAEAVLRAIAGEPGGDACHAMARRYFEEVKG